MTYHSLGSFGFVIHSVRAGLLTWGPQNILHRWQTGAHCTWSNMRFVSACCTAGASAPLSRMAYMMVHIQLSLQGQLSSSLVRKCSLEHAVVLPIRIGWTLPWWSCLQFEPSWVWGELPRWQNLVEAVCCQSTSRLLVPYPLFTQSSARATVLYKLCTNLNDKRSEKQWKHHVSEILRVV